MLFRSYEMLRSPACLRPGVAAILLTLATLIGPQGTVHADAGPPLNGLFADNFIRSEPPKPAPATVFSDLDGQARSLADFRGRVVLLNFWATWCAPCIHEMPSLDRLQASLGPEGLTVIALSVDRGGAHVVAPFLTRLGIEHLEVFLDPSNETGRSFAVPGLPTTYLIDQGGQIVGALAGPAEWDSPDAKALIRYYLDAAGTEQQLQQTDAGATEPAADCGCSGPKAAKARQARKSKAVEPDAQRVGTGSSPE